MLKKNELLLMGNAAWDSVKKNMSSAKTIADVTLRFDVAIQAVANYAETSLAKKVAVVEATPAKQKQTKPVVQASPSKVRSEDMITTGNNLERGTDSEQYRVAMAYRGGKSLKDAGNIDGKHRSWKFARRACALHGVPIRHGREAIVSDGFRNRFSKNYMTDEMKAISIQLYKCDFSEKQIAKTLSLSHSSVRNLIDREGLTRNRVESAKARARYDARVNGLMPWPKDMPDLEKLKFASSNRKLIDADLREKVVSFHQAGLTNEEVGRRIGRSSAFVSRIRKELGLASPRGRKKKKLVRPVSKKTSATSFSKQEFLQ